MPKELFTKKITVKISLYRHICVTLQPDKTSQKKQIIHIMINRVIIRSKVVQEAYSYFITENKSIADAEKDLLHSLKKGHELYYALLQLMIDLTDLQAQRIETARNKYLPSEEDLNPNMRFVENRFIKSLRNNADFVEHYKSEPFSWKVSAEGFLNRMLDTILASDEYRAYMTGPFNDAESDCELWRTLFKNVIAPSDDLTDTVENISLYWNEELNVEATFVLKTIKHFRGENENVRMLPMYKDEEDRTFAVELLRNTLINAKLYRNYIDRFTSNWEIERIAFMDVVIMMIAISELLKMTSIPTVVTLNEYIELAKTYSTEQSSTFINGVLDAIVKELKKEGIITKN